MINAVLDHIKSRETESLARMKAFLRIPSISTDPDRKEDTRKAAHWILELFNGCGIQAELVETPGHPAVLADTGPGKGDGPTILVYGHYDVQPVGERSLWRTEPFDPTEVDGAIFARGSADDKGQVITHMLAAEAWKKAAGGLPIRVKFLIEGEEEIGSPNLRTVIESRREALKCDYVVLSDTAKLNWDIPAITYGTKGLIYKQIDITGPKQDLHSGAFGGTVTNPGNALARIIASMHDSKNRVAIPGFYDAVRALPDAERKALAALPYSEGDYLKMVGSPSLHGEEGYTTNERRWIRPTVDVNGVFGGFMAEGQSTIIPKQVGAKVSMRLVPDQEPETIGRLFDEHVQRVAPPGINVKVRTLASAGPYVCPLDLPGLVAAKAAIKDGYGKPPVLMREGGTLPILPMFKKLLGAESIMIGFSVPDCNLHGPNEFFHIDDFYKGIRTCAWLVHHLAKSQ